MSDRLPIAEGIVDGTSHSLIVILPFLASARSTGQFSIGQDYAVFLGSPLHHPQVIGAYLMSESARAGVNHDCDLVFPCNSKHLRCLWIRYFVDLLNL